MTELVHIPDHIAIGVSRLLQKYKGKPLFTGVLNAGNAQVQELEDCLFDMVTNRNIFTAIGKQLDKIGLIIGLPRPSGYDDETYRGLLLGKVGVNVSQGQPESLISFYKIFTQANFVHLQETPPGANILMSDTEVDPNLVQILSDFLRTVVSAGVRVSHYGVWDGVEGFALAGPGGGPSLGLGTITDLAVGGKLARLYHPIKPLFALDSGTIDNDADGLGTLMDPVVGGNLRGL